MRLASDLSEYANLKIGHIRLGAEFSAGFEEAIPRYIRDRNRQARPFFWTRTADNSSKSNTDPCTI